MTDGVGPVGGLLGEHDRHPFIYFNSDMMFPTTGCDLSGIVEEVGSECKTEVKKGDNVFGVCHCANHVRPLPIHVSECNSDPVLSSNNLKMELSQSLPWSRMATWLRFQTV